MTRLRTVCRAFKDLIDTHEHVIVAAMLSNHRGTNIALLSELFPPPRTRTTGNPRRPTLHYIYSLETRHGVCADLAHNLAKRAIATLFDNKASNTLSRKERDVKRERAMRTIQRRLVLQLYHVEHFLVNTRLHFSRSLTSMAVEGGGEGPPPDLLAQMYREVQIAIINQWPDSVLLSTHHAFHFLVNTIRLAISPEPPHNTNDDIVSVMLRCPTPLQRCNEFFAADTPSTSGRLRRQFMLDMQDEKVRTELLANLLFEDGIKTGKRRGSSLYKGPSWTPRMGEVWFESARNGLRARGLERHRADGMYYFPEVQGEVMVGCPDCQVRQ